MENVGVLNFDRGSVIGRVRVMSGDSTGVAQDPSVLNDEGQELGSFELWSDEEIRGFLDVADNSPTKAIGYGYLALASAAAIESKNVKDYDLQVDLTKRATDLRETAKSWFERANDEAVGSEGYDVFQVFDVVPAPTHVPEGAPWRW